MTAYYNEHDPFAAAWLRELIADGLIAPGEVDERDIQDVTPDELRSFRQCHFFAGIGVWSLAARRAGIPDDAPLWSGSCPCQPFSTAGKGGGFADERHLWPALHYLIEQCSPPVVVGEQVAGIDGDTWLDLVSADLDATGYAFGAAETCAAGFGAPHIRTRNYWVAYSASGRRKHEQGGCAGRARICDAPTSPRERLQQFGADGASSMRVAESNHHGQRQHRDSVGSATRSCEGGLGQRERVRPDPADDGAVRGLAHRGRQRRSGKGLFTRRGRSAVAALDDWWPVQGNRPGPTNGWWRDADWLRCRDEPVPKWRPVEPGTFPLVNAGTFRNRVGLLRGAGNAITIGQAEGFLRAVIGSLSL